MLKKFNNYFLCCKLELLFIDKIDNYIYNLRESCVIEKMKIWGKNFFKLSIIILTCCLCQANLDKNYVMMGLEYKNYRVSNRNVSFFLRAGGGTSSSSSSSSTSGSSHGSTKSYNSRYNPVSSFINLLIFGGVVLIISSYKRMYLFIRTRKMNDERQKVQEKLAVANKNWDYDKIDENISKAFYTIQNDWTNMKIQEAKKYLSKDLYERFKSQLEWMSFKEEKNVLKDIKLICSKIIILNEVNSYIWVYIKGRMIDYTIDINTHKKINGSYSRGTFVEFWKFNLTKESLFVLDKIKQEDDFYSLFD